MSREILFFDTEVNPRNNRVFDYGALKDTGEEMRSSSGDDFGAFIHGASWLSGHNILDFDLQYTGGRIMKECPDAGYIDTLYLSPLMFPERPYHRLIKDDKLQNDELNNPLSDAKQSRKVFEDERAAFLQMSETQQALYAGLLGSTRPFSGFFQWMEQCAPEQTSRRIQHMRELPAEQREKRLTEWIRVLCLGRICMEAELEPMIRECAVELGYAIALILTDDRYSVTPPWVIRRFPRMEEVMHRLRGQACENPECLYCRRKLDVRKRLKDIFGFDSFRTYDGVPLQELAAEAAVKGRSLLAVFPTGGGKSLTFQLPALMAGEVSRGLTVVISPLQSLMKDQVDHLEERGIADAVTLNGLLDPVERKEAVERVESGIASLLYISPESLRNRTVEHLLLNQQVARFVIDEAHCFSAWGQDFRVDYLYIGEFIRKLSKKKQLKVPIPVSCFTATAKQKVISDIQDYFRRTLGIELELYTTRAERENLRYQVIYLEDEERKYAETRRLILGKRCPTIVYASRVKKTRELAGRLRRDGISAEPYNGKMDSAEKVRIQNAFLRDEVQVIVATSAFGMGVDKPDVGLVIHYDIADSLENYTQEAGRAGRNPSLEADCYVLFNDGDLDKHFILLNQTKLSLSEINQVWKSIKELLKRRQQASFSALEIARQAGWDDSVTDPETRVTGAIAALENAGYLVRGQNMPHVYANSIQAANMAEASLRLEETSGMNEKDRETARRVLGYLISRKNTGRGRNDAAESRVDYLADKLGLKKETVIRSIQQMRDEGLLADQMDLSVYIRRTDTENRSAAILREFRRAEEFMIDHLPAGEPFNYRELNDRALRSGVEGCTVKKLKTLVFYWTLTGELRKTFNPDDERVILQRTGTPAEQWVRFRRRSELSRFIVEYLYIKSAMPQEAPAAERPGGERGEESGMPAGKPAPAGTRRDADGDSMAVPFSVKEIETAFSRHKELGLDAWETSAEEVQRTLLYLSKIQALTLDGGFLVSYNAMQIQRKEMNNRIDYKKQDYAQLEAFYEQRMEQIHIMGEYAHLMVRDYDEALRFVRDYFQMDYRQFLERYFQGERRKEIRRNITPGRYKKLFGALSPAQREIIDDDRPGSIAVLAGPGSGKTRVLVHKLAALLTMDDVKHDQMLMLTFSRAAATEFKRRLLELVGNAAHFVEIKTFHSYCFDLLGRIGTLEETDHAVADAVQLIRDKKAEIRRITKTVLVIDEAQDMDADEFELVRTLMENNKGLRVIAVGDDDQNIYSFRGSDARYLDALRKLPDARTYELLENYRSDQHIVALANAFAGRIRTRLKTKPIRPVREDEGETVLRRYTAAAGGLEVPAAEYVRDSWLQGAGTAETRCVLTATNEEAALIAGLLNRMGVPVRLAQSNEGFDLYHLAEMRHFLRLLDAEIAAADSRGEQAAEDREKASQAGGPEQVRTAAIPESIWRKAAEGLRRNYRGSTALPLCLRMIETFEKVNPVRFRSDWVEFLHESRLEDFAETAGGTVTVSTMHGAKGREFDRVDLVLHRYDFSEDEKKRTVYVAMTRAKHRLTIHTDSGFFDAFAPLMTETERVTKPYGEPDQMRIPLTHRDVDLSFFKRRQEQTLSLRAGQRLRAEGNLLRTEDGRTALRFSRAFSSRLERLRQKGYTITEAGIRFVAAWKGKDEPKEVPIALPEIELQLSIDKQAAADKMKS